MSNVKNSFDQPGADGDNTLNIDGTMNVGSAATVNIDGTLNASASSTVSLLGETLVGNDFRTDGDGNFPLRARFVVFMPDISVSTVAVTELNAGWVRPSFKGTITKWTTVIGAAPGNASFNVVSVRIGEVIVGAGSMQFNNADSAGSSQSQNPGSANTFNSTDVLQVHVNAASTGVVPAYIMIECQLD